jgi:hypothetical protein
MTKEKAWIASRPNAAARKNPRLNIIHRHDPAPPLSLLRFTREY